MICPHCLKLWLGAVGQQAIGRANADPVLCRHMASLGHNELKYGWVLDSLNTLRPRQNGRRFADDTFKRIFLNENVWILISLNIVPDGPTNYSPALGQIMAWRWLDDKPLTEPIMVLLLTHICVTRPQWTILRKYKCVFAFHINTRP